MPPTYMSARTTNDAPLLAKTAASSSSQRRPGSPVRKGLEAITARSQSSLHTRRMNSGFPSPSQASPPASVRSASGRARPSISETSNPHLRRTAAAW
jgi:hypothetical protein